MTSVDAVQTVADVSKPQGPASKPNMDSATFLSAAELAVIENFNSHRKPDRSPELTIDGIQMVSFARVLNGHTVIFMSPLARGLLWQITYNRSKHEMYLDVYNKLNNTKINMQEIA
jgi:hypothetical protein